MVTEMPRHSALRCVSSIRQNNAKPLISNGLRFIITCLLTAALGVLFHVARHSFAVMALQRGVTLHMISRLMGHASIITTENTYAEFLPSTINEEVKSKLSFCFTPTIDSSEKN